MPWFCWALLGFVAVAALVIVVSRKAVSGMVSKQEELFYENYLREGNK